MKNLIVTRCDSNIQWQADITHDLIKDYAVKCGADFEILSHETNLPGDGRWHYRIMKCYDLFERYDRILHIDTDVLINPICPNIFDLVDYKCVASVLEDKGSRKAARMECINKAQDRYGDVGWLSGYVNTGFFLSSKVHRDIFQPINGEFYNDIGFDDVHLGYQINKHKFELHELSYKWNHMTMFSEPWNGSVDRFSSYIIHYAGNGLFDCRNKKLQMVSDKNRLIV